MIVRESPKSARRQQSQQNWPPQSAREALLSSPGGRKRYERQRERTTSPSPTKRRAGDNTALEEEEEDEETLELQLQAIEARLKLKKLQQAKAKQTGDGEGDTVKSRPGTSVGTSRPGTSASLRRPELPRPESSVQVPVSPIRNRRAQEEQTSPKRVVLGIDKGLKAQDVSLKRAASFSARSNTRDTSGSLSRAHSRAGESQRGKSFSERLAEGRQKDKEREERQTRIEKSRSRGFGLDKIEGLRDGQSSRAGSSMSSGTIKSGQSNKDLPPPKKGSDLLKSRSIGDLRAEASPRPASGLSARSNTPSTTSMFSRGSSSTTAKSSAESSSETPSIFESFSGLHLSKRQTPHNVLARTFDGKSIFTIPQLLKVVKSPEYDPPDVENDYVIVGVIASKSSPLTPKNARRDQSTGNSEVEQNGQAGKFMVVRVTDLKWEVDLFLFDTGFSQFWKLPIGTLIAILNPDIMPPRNRDTGKFSLKLTSSDDTVLEIGQARDLDFCHAMRKDGKECGQWIDGRKTKFCDFHVEMHVEKHKRGRMEVNTMTGFGKGPGKGNSGSGQGGKLKDDGLTRHGKFHDKFLHETMFITGSSRNAAQLLDEEDSGFERGASRAELHRKRLADKEKERELAKKLGQIGTGAGGDYMRLKGADTPHLPSRGDLKPAEASSSTTDKDEVLADAADILLGKTAADVSLSPVKRKRIISGKGKSNEPVGWSGAFKRGLSPTKQPAQVREPSPAKKKARFMLEEKGIREPGRDSLGGLDVGLLAAMDDEDDDGLDIV